MEIERCSRFSHTISCCFVVVCVLVPPPSLPVSAATNRGGKQVPCETLTASHRRDQLHARVHTALKISEAPLRVLPKGGNYGAPQAHAQDPIPEDDLGTPQQSTNWGWGRRWGTDAGDSAKRTRKTGNVSGVMMSRGNQSNDGAKGKLRVRRISPASPPLSSPP